MPHSTYRRFRLFDGIHLALRGFVKTDRNRLCAWNPCTAGDRAFCAGEPRDKRPSLARASVPYEERDCPFVQRLSPPGQVAEPGLMEKCAKHRVQELQCRRFPKPRCPATVPQPPHNVLGAQQDSARGFRGISSCRGAGSVQTDYITTSGRALLVSGPMACRWRPRRADILLGKLTRKQGCGKRFRRQ